MDSDSKVTLLVGGDIQFDQVARPERKIFSIDESLHPISISDKIRCLYYNLGLRYPNLFKKIGRFIGDWFNRKHFRIMNDLSSYKTKFFVQQALNTKENIERWHILAPNNEVITADTYDFQFKNEEEQKLFPFQGVKQLINKSDLTFCNLECPISDKGKVRGMFRADPIYAESIRQAGVDVVSIANNHAFDASEEGFLETINNLENNKIFYVGGGRKISDARKPAIIEKNDLNFAFLGYSKLSDIGFYDDVADENKPGMLPFSPDIIIEDIIAAKKDKDIVVLSLHWELANTPYVHKKSVEYAHRFIDAGADIIVGHHPHVIKGIEIYKKRPIFYSLGNFIFGFSYRMWKDNFLSQICFKGKSIEKILIYPISGKGKELFQPFLLEDKRAKELLKYLETISSGFGTTIELADNVGTIRI